MLARATSITANQLVAIIADCLQAFDATRPVHKEFKPGIGPFGEPQLLIELAQRLTQMGLASRTKRTPDLEISDSWAIEFKIVRPFGDNGKEAENWSVNMLHPYSGNVSLIGDALKLERLDGNRSKLLCVIGFEHCQPLIELEPLILSFEAISRNVLGLQIGDRIDEIRQPLVHPVHQRLRCVAWPVLSGQT